jgi:hypothetical protein
MSAFQKLLIYQPCAVGDKGERPEFKETLSGCLLVILLLFRFYLLDKKYVLNSDTELPLFIISRLIGYSHIRL